MYLAKPVDPGELIAAIDMLAPQGSRAGVTP
jgi:DNA-binding response OmpR family regulator